MRTNSIELENPGISSNTARETSEADTNRPRHDEVSLNSPFLPNSTFLNFLRPSSFPLLLFTSFLSKVVVSPCPCPP